MKPTPFEQVGPNHVWVIDSDIRLHLLDQGEKLGFAIPRTNGRMDLSRLPVEQPDAVRSYYLKNLEAGADVLHTIPSLDAVTSRLYFHKEARIDLLLASAGLAMEGAEEWSRRGNRRPLVAGVVSGTSWQGYDPATETVRRSDWVAAYVEQIAALRDAGVDLILFKDIFTIRSFGWMAEAQVRAEAEQIPFAVFVQWSDAGHVGGDVGRLLFGDSLARFSHAATAANPMAVGTSGVSNLPTYRHSLANLRQGWHGPFAIAPHAGYPCSRYGYCDPFDLFAFCVAMLHEGPIRFLGGSWSWRLEHTAAAAAAVRHFAGGTGAKDPGRAEYEMALSN